MGNRVQNFRLSGNPARVTPLNNIRYIGKILDYKHPALILQDANSNELGKGRSDIKLLDEIADRLKRQLPGIEFYGDYLYAYDKVRKRGENLTEMR